MKRESNGQQLDRGAARARWVGEYRASGVGLKRFAREHGLSTGQLHYWVYGSPKGRTAPAAVPVFQEVRLAQTAGAPGRWSAEVGLPDGTTVRLGRQADPEWAKALIDFLRRP